MIVLNGSRTAMHLTASLSSTFFISFQSRVYCTTFSLPDREQFTLSINSLSIYGVYPLFFSPLIVSRRGSSHPSTTPFSINSFIFLFDSTLPSMFRREYSQTVGLYNPSRSRKVQQSSLRTSNSREQREQSMCSKLSLMQCVKSYIGQMRYLLPVRGCGLFLSRYMMGSRRVGLGWSGTPFSLRVWLYAKLGNIFSDYSMLLCLYGFGCLFFLSASISSCELSQTYAFPCWMSLCAKYCNCSKQSLAKVTLSGVYPSHRTFSSIYWMNSCVYLSGLVSSQRRKHVPPFLMADQKFTRIDLTCPMWRYPLGQGGKRKRGRFWVIFKCYSQISLELHSYLIRLGLIYNNLSQSLFYFLGGYYLDGAECLQMRLTLSQMSLLSMVKYFSLIDLQTSFTSLLSCLFSASNYSSNSLSYSLLLASFLSISCLVMSLLTLISRLSHLTTWSNSYWFRMPPSMISSDSAGFNPCNASL